MQVLQQQTQVKSSFFDDHTENFSIWKKGTPSKKSSEARVMEGILFKRSSRTNFWKSRYYVLFEDRLACYKNGRENKEQSHCWIQNMRLEMISNSNEKDEKYGIRLTHNGVYCDLFARAKDQYDKWISILSSFCVLESFASNFVNIKMIGRGSFAKVYLVKRKSDNKDLAVKTFDKSLLLKQEKAKASLINEINIMRRLSHDNIIKLHEVYESDNHVYLVQELLNGGELFDRIVKKGHYSEKDACTLMRKLLSALAYMHSRGIMHRDIKPENLILKDVENDWNVKIADFGLATFINPNNDYLFKRCGTPGYVAPEILEDAKYDSKVDVFSAGVILFILLTGGSPFHGKSYNEILWKNKVCEINFDFKAKGLKASDLAIDLLKKMLAKDPMNRITAEQALKHEWIVIGGSDVGASPSTSYYLSSAQENMKRFQEENRFNVKNIKPKGFDGSSFLETCGHAPSPLINGQVTTMVGSMNQSLLNSPDIRRTSIMSTNKTKLTEAMSPRFVMSLSGVQQDNSPHSTAGDESEDLMDAISDEHSSIIENISKYSNGFNLITQVRDNNSSASSSNHSTPLMSLRPYNPDTAKKAMNAQENLLNYLKPINNAQTVLESNFEHQKKTGVVKENLKHFY